MEGQAPYLKQITLRKCKALVRKPNGDFHTCVFGDYETIMARAMILQDETGKGRIEEYQPTMTLAVRRVIGYVLEDGTKIFFEQRKVEESGLSR